MNGSIAQKGLLGLAVLLAAFYATLGVYILFDEDTSLSTIVSAVVAVLYFAGGAMILAGLRLSKQAPWLGGALLVVGALPLGLFVFWMVIPPVVAVLVTVFGVRRAIRFAREPGRIAPA